MAQASAGLLWTTSPFLVSCATFIAFALTVKQALTAEVIFPALSLFNLLSFPLGAFPMAISSLVAANIAVKPLQAFFNSDELQADAAMRQEISGSQTSEPVIKVHKVAFSWTRKMEQPSLQIERFEANAGSFCCIIGGVGSGKSTFLQPQFSARVRNSKAPSNDPETVVSSLGPSGWVNTPQRASWRAYLDYARATTLPGLVIYFTSLIGSQFASAGSRIWIKVWADSKQSNGAYGNVAMYIGVYFAFGVGSAMARAVEELCLYILCGLVVWPQFLARYTTTDYLGCKESSRRLG